jgi:hypothetical protein
LSKNGDYSIRYDLYTDTTDYYNIAQLNFSRFPSVNLLRFIAMVLFGSRKSLQKTLG